ncbi:hypothetical protein FHR21_000351 [Sphingopyxis panaciterrulae]|uniref:Uncharacterized protein n=1 Tax=Sphingopyxis panaciterrulae TaxID=462372 RepID=A0A7W9B2H7_9SPHN|nr:hypothetical protein [Sphingopyxis panaciterrulae]
MADRDDDDHHSAILYLRDHAIVADAIAPVTGIVADESVAALAGIIQSGDLAQCFDDSLLIHLGETVELLVDAP